MNKATAGLLMQIGSAMGLGSILSLMGYGITTWQPWVIIALIWLYGAGSKMRADAK